MPDGALAVRVQVSIVAVGAAFLRCPTMLTYAHLYLAIPSYAYPCPAIPRYAYLCPPVPNYANLGIPNAQLCPSMLSYAQLCSATPWSVSSYALAHAQLRTRDA